MDVRTAHTTGTHTRKPLPPRPLRVWLPGRPVSVNAMYGRGASGRVYLRPAAREWKTLVRDTVGYEARVQGFPTHEKLHAATLSIDIQGAGLDADNAVKLIQDGIAAGLGVNDKIFTLGRVNVQRLNGKNDRAGVWLTIEAAS